MGLAIFESIEQGSDSWHAARRGIVTASVIGKLVTPKTIKVCSNDYSRALTAQLVAERITGYTDPTYINDDMMRGMEDEPRARDKYSEHFAPARETGFMVRTEPTWTLGYSPDGLVGDDGLIEVKSRRQKKHLTTILADAVVARKHGPMSGRTTRVGPRMDRLHLLQRWPTDVRQARTA